MKTEIVQYSCNLCQKHTDTMLPENFPVEWIEIEAGDTESDIYVHVCPICVNKILAARKGDTHPARRLPPLDPSLIQLTGDGPEW